MTTDTTGTVATGTPAATPAQGPVSAYDRMLAFLGQEDSAAQAEATAEEQSGTADPNAEGVEGEGEEKAAEATTESDESTESEEGEEGEQSAAESIYTVRVDGKDEQVPLSELLAGYSRTSDYTRKTQEVANQRKSLEQIQSQLVQERQEYQQLLPKLKEMISYGEQEPNWEEMRARDPVQALIAKQRWDERQKRIDQLTAEEKRVAEQEEQRIEGERQQFVAQQRDKLLANPLTKHWSDATKRQADAKSIAETLLGAGYTEAELAIYDSRAMLIAYKAALYDKSQAKHQQAVESVKQKTGKSPVVRPGAPSTKPKGESRKAFDRLAKSGSKADAEAWFLHNL
jgi:hypothetical protein